MTAVSDQSKQALLSAFLFTIYDHGTSPNALGEAQAILDFLDKLDNRPCPPPPPAPPRHPKRADWK